MATSFCSSESTPKARFKPSGFPEISGDSTRTRRRPPGPVFFSDGIAAMSEGLCHSLGIGIDHVAVVHFDGLAGLVDRVGGVQVQSESILLDLSAGLVMKAGQSELQEDEALAYIQLDTSSPSKMANGPSSLNSANNEASGPSPCCAALDHALSSHPPPQLHQSELPTRYHRCDLTLDEVGPLDAIELGRALRSIEGDRSTLPSERPKLGTAAEDVPMLVPTADSLKAAHEFVGGPSTTCTQPLDN